MVDMVMNIEEKEKRTLVSGTYRHTHHRICNKDTPIPM
jgi:hypothetical protein